MRERKFEDALITKIKEKFQDVILITNDGYQSRPDILILFKGGWAVLQIKKSKNSFPLPSQKIWMEMLSDIACFASWVYPENEKEVLEHLEIALEIWRWKK